MKTLNDLTRYANEFLDKEYGLSLAIPLRFNGRLKTTMGRVVFYRNRKTGDVIANSVELSTSMVQSNSVELICDILKHELVHYALFIKNLPYSDGHPVFERELKRLGVVSQSNIGEQTITRKVQVYKCSDCGKEIIRKRRLTGHISNYRCKCGGRLGDLGKVFKTF